KSATQDKPVVTPKDTLQNELEWKRSGVYPFLFTNIPSRFTRFSYLPDPEKYHDKSRKIYPFLFHQELAQRFTDFIESEKLDKHIRLNTTVENVHKNSKGKWVISVRHKNPETNQNEWYQEEFDAVVVANGHYTVPYIPEIEGLAEYNAKHPNVLIHAKSLRELDDFKDKDVLVVGGSISTANIIQYIIPVAKSVTNAKRGKSLVFEYINDALAVPEIDGKGTIDKIDPESGEVYFVDGTHKKFDKILFTTGYHYNYPFLADKLELVNPGNLSRVKGLYYDTFYQQDPTLGITGVAVSHLNFHTIEASVAALAGVWSGAKELPTVQEQQDWEKSEVERKGNSIFFHYYSHHDAKDQFVDKLVPYFAEGRYNPLEKEGPLVGEIDQGLENLAKYYYLIKDSTTIIMTEPTLNFHVQTHQTQFKVPVELIKKNFKNIQKLIEKQKKQLTDDITKIKKVSSLSASAKLELIQKLIKNFENFQKKLTNSIKKDEEFRERLITRLENLQTLEQFAISSESTEDEDEADKLLDLHNPNLINWYRDQTNLLIIDYLIKSNTRTDENIGLMLLNSLAKNNPKLMKLIDYDLYESFNQVFVSIMNDHDLTLIIAWFNENRNSLKKINSNLEFEINYCKFLTLIEKGDINEAINFSRENLSSYGNKENYPDSNNTNHLSNLERLKGLGGLLVFRSMEQEENSEDLTFSNKLMINSIQFKEYQKLLSNERWESLSQCFIENFTKLYGITKNYPIYIYLSAGLSSLKTKSCYHNSENTIFKDANEDNEETFTDDVILNDKKYRGPNYYYRMLDRINHCPYIQQSI
ncbi:hypothetical protein G210_3750, partial [Candida maltosa Xu316]